MGRRSPEKLKTSADALLELIDLMQDLAAEGRSVLSVLMDPALPPKAWAHCPEDDACDRRTGYRWYYHCHAGAGRIDGEHGHFHVFADGGEDGVVTHLVAVSVDARGWPLALVALNRWVTDEHWQPSASVLRLVERFAMHAPASLSRIHRWLRDLLHAFLPQIQLLLDQRDARLNSLRQTSRSDVFEDRRISVLSQCRIDLMKQSVALDA